MEEDLPVISEVKSLKQPEVKLQPDLEKCSEDDETVKKTSIEEQRETESAVACGDDSDSTLEADEMCEVETASKLEAACKKEKRAAPADDPGPESKKSKPAEEVNQEADDAGASTDGGETFKKGPSIQGLEPFCPLISDMLPSVADHYLYSITDPVKWNLCVGTCLSFDKYKLDYVFDTPPRPNILSKRATELKAIVYHKDIHDLAKILFVNGVVMNTKNYKEIIKKKKNPSCEKLVSQVAKAVDAPNSTTVNEAEKERGIILYFLLICSIYF
jgi:hypothetical protein